MKRTSLKRRGRPARATIRKGVRVAGPLEYGELIVAAYRESEGLCACGCCRRAESLHHLVPGRRDDMLISVVPLYGDGTRGCHGALTSACKVHNLDGTVCDPLDVATGVRGYLEAHPEKIAYVVQVKGIDYLDRRYPLP